MKDQYIYLDSNAIIPEAYVRLWGCQIAQSMGTFIKIKNMFERLDRF